MLVAVATAAFGLGRLSFYSEKQVPVTLRLDSQTLEEVSNSAPSEAQAEIEAEVKGAAVETSGSVVASKNSDKYHFPWCSGAKRISAENRIVFSSAEEARKAGFSPAANCKGLK
ncbi:hypothetical protein EPN83_02235 [Patescibacteria group bacterium]|nr:MAG: hypothetical protein EPN83_02235 [Patescibacteria group bacterium]